MIIFWIIGVFLSFLGIWFLKNSRYCIHYNCEGGKPILKMWMLILLLIVSIIPVINVIGGIIVITKWIRAVYGDKKWEFTKENNKISRFLNKPIG